MLDLTIAIPVRNEQSNLPSCLSAIGTNFASKVVLIDSGSNDSTASIAFAYGAEVIQFAWNGRFPKKRNWFLKHHTPATRWVLFLDADEFLTAAVKQEISEVLPGTRHQGFFLNYTNYFLNRRLRGGYPLRKLALFQVGKGSYEYIPEENWSECDMEVHEHPIICGSTGSISNQIEHRDHRSIDSYIIKHNEYASWEAHRLFALRFDTASRKNFTFKQIIKYRLLCTPWCGIFYFVFSYIFMGSWRDGSVGIAFSSLKSAYFVQVSCRFRELIQSHQRHSIDGSLIASEISNSNFSLPSISVIVLTKNEEADLPACLASLSWCRDIHVVDSESSDNTCQVAQRFGANVLINSFNSFAQQRNWAIDNCPINSEWILFVDADERSTLAFYTAVIKAIQSASISIAGFYCCSKTILGDRWLKRSDNFPKWQFRLLRRERATFSDSGHGQKEGLVNGDIDYINEPYLHFAFSRGWYSWEQKHLRYAIEDAQELLSASFIFVQLFSPHGSVRHSAIKHMARRIPFWPHVRFVFTYFLSGGFLDGSEGFLYSRKLFWYEVQVSKNLRLLCRLRRNS
jgi:glycosyltransferase involved in cell wall biosynthesis